ncbi:hypothetical protein N7532_009940 [Penicillium argentinense]|uniref:Uncharacterized protein n=1 Tax=Penicillium argentinense TaxID=1131581 RepID=A0A9W9JX60_9EURO|nr:uncharacterized protein N7532_009940 [Penicillium argentinense]KAJ5085169.1 hypothetical protein N7532_009940 [Penicillium argentinense]
MDGTSPRIVYLEDPLCILNVASHPSLIDQEFSVGAVPWADERRATALNTSVFDADFLIGNTVT